MTPKPRPIGDLLTEVDETFKVVLSAPSPAPDVTLAPDECNITVIDDDAAISVGPASIGEGDSGQTNLTFTVTLSHPNPRPVSFNWSTSPGTATSGTDYVAVSGAAASIPIGTPSKTFTVKVNGDVTPEADETFSVTLSSVVGGQPGTPISAVMQITDDDTLPAVCTVGGTPGNDTLNGTPGADVYCGLGGNDTFMYSGGNDIFWGGSPGVETGGGVDTIDYTTFGGGYVDAQLFTGGIILKNNADVVLATHEEHAVENITGSPGDDLLRGDHSANRIRGGGGKDVLGGYDGDDNLDGGTGTDTVTYFNATAPVTVNLSLTVQNTGGAGTDTITKIESLIGSEGIDTLTGNADGNTISGLGAADTIFAGGGNDTVFGLGGADSIHGENGNDKLNGGDDSDFVFGGDGSDVVHGDDHRDRVDGGPGDFDKVYGDGGTESANPLDTYHVSGGDGIHDNCKQAGPSQTVGFDGPGCENDVARLPAGATSTSLASTEARRAVFITS